MVAHGGNMVLKEIIADIKQNVPCYCFDIDRFKVNILKLKEAFGGRVNVIYSAKANPHMISTALICADGVEVCSFGEISHLHEYQDYADRVTFGGVYKSEAEWNLALKYGIRRFSVESIAQLQLLVNLCYHNDIAVSVLLRITSGNQFGMSVEEAIDCFTKYADCSLIRLSGIHYYSGTMKTKASEINSDFTNLNDIVFSMNSCDVEEIEYGAGIAVDYYSNLEIGDCYNAMVDNTNKLAKSYKVTYEAGRILSADCGVYIARIDEIKKREQRTYVVLNGGGHQFTYYNSIYNRSRNRTPGISVISQKMSSEKENYTIVGALCSAGDILAMEIQLNRLYVDDYVVFHKAGAYCSTEGMALFLSRDIPAIYLIEKSGHRLIRNRFQLGEEGAEII
jgi:diaminopimelate decarboxylase